MASTTYVQFIKGGLLLIFSTILVILLLNNGFNTQPSRGLHQFTISSQWKSPSRRMGRSRRWRARIMAIVSSAGQTVDAQSVRRAGGKTASRRGGIWTRLTISSVLTEALSIVEAEGAALYNGEPQANEKFYQVGHFSEIVVDGEEVDSVKGREPRRSSSSIIDGQRNCALWQSRF
jgi:cation/acetate symporter